MRHNFRSRALASVAAVAIAASGALGAALYEGRPAFAQGAAAPITVPATVQAPASFADIVDRVKPAVVSVRVKVENAMSDGEGLSLDNLPPQMRELFRRFGENGPRFGENGQPGRGPRGERPQVRQGVGSGFFISADGYVVTNNHVVDHAKTVQVTTDDGRTLDAKVIGADSKTDVALLKVTEGGNFPYVSLAKGSPRVGDWVVAIGNPFGLGGTVTAGIVSARGRDIGAGPYDDFLQIDAPINKGNSGGPTFNLSGEVVGMNTAIYSPSGGSVGLAFAVPASTVQTVVDQLKQDGKVSRGYLGVSIQPVTKDLAEGLGLTADKGALVSGAQDGTPAAKAGLKSGDVIVAVNGEKVADARELTRRIGAMKPGAKAEITYLRDGKERTAVIELAPQPGEKQASIAPSRGGTDDGLPKLGLELAPARDGEEGVVVAGVDPDGPAAQKGIKDGDVILEIGGRPVSQPADVKAGLEAAHKDGRKAVLMRVKSREGVRFVAIAMPKAG
ncbi:MAG TPA: Do family serine endopeptidase [Beijerinckiaceae bacterium]|jgi:serine protease Do